MYRVVRGLFRLIALPMFRFRVEGAERVPASGPGVVVAPHRSWLDPACVGGACPRPVRFLIMDSVYRRAWSRWFYRGLRAIPVSVGGGPATLTSLRGALRALSEGELVGVFPEGRVKPEGRIGDLHAGAAMLSVRGRAPVIPMVIHGSARAWPHGRKWPAPARVRVRVGHPIEPPEGTDRDTVARCLASIEQELGRLADGENDR